MSDLSEVFSKQAAEQARKYIEVGIKEQARKYIEVGIKFYRCVGAESPVTIDEVLAYWREGHPPGVIAQCDAEGNVMGYGKAEAS